MVGILGDQHRDLAASMNASINVRPRRRIIFRPALSA